MEFTSISKLITKYRRLRRDVLVPEVNMCRSVAATKDLVRAT
jgi:hypothetical protein